MAMDDDAGLSRGAGVDSFMPGAETSSPRVQPAPTPMPSPPVSASGVTPATGATDAAATPVPAATPMPPVQPVAPPPTYIPDEAVKAYIARCLQPQQKWFSAKATKCKRAHNMVITAQVVATTSIPLLNMLVIQYRNFAYVSTVAAAVSGLAAGVAGFGKFKEHWLRYRQNSTALENLQLEYELCLPPFDGPDRNNLLIVNVRNILAEEQKLWIADVNSGTAVRGTAGGVPLQAKPGTPSGIDENS